MTLNKILSQFSKMNKQLDKFMERKDNLIEANNTAICNLNKTKIELQEDSAEHYEEIRRAKAVQDNVKVLIGEVE